MLYDVHFFLMEILNRTFWMFTYLVNSWMLLACKWPDASLPSSVLARVKFSSQLCAKSLREACAHQNAWISWKSCNSFVFSFILAWYFQTTNVHFPKGTMSPFFYGFLYKKKHVLFVNCSPTKWFWFVSSIILMHSTGSSIFLMGATMVGGLGVGGVLSWRCVSSCNLSLPLHFLLG